MKYTSFCTLGGAEYSTVERPVNRKGEYMKRPTLFINTISLLSPLTGIGRYTYEIAKNMKEESTFKTYYFYGYNSHILIHPLKNRYLKKLILFITKNPKLKKIVRKILKAAGKIYTPNHDIYWQPNFIPNDSIKAKKIITSVHDFSFLLYKEFHPKERIEYFEKCFFKHISKSDKIICSSNFTKYEILEKIKIDEKKVHVIHLGIDHNLFKVYDDLNVNFELPQKFIFYAGSIEPRKNLIGLLKAYHNLNSNIKSIYKLVLAGFYGWENDEIMKQISKDKENIHYLGYISDEELAKVYNLASLFVYPSYYEGFGLPPLEAMSCGTPVITSQIASLPEVGGDAVVYCNPYSVEDIKEKMEEVLNNFDLQKEMVEKGLLRAKQFTWDKAAKEHIKVFNEVLKS